MPKKENFLGWLEFGVIGLNDPFVEVHFLEKGKTVFSLICYTYTLYVYAYYIIT